MNHALELVPANDLRSEDGWWVSTGSDPYFILRPQQGQCPSGWCVVRFDARSDGETLAPILYIDDGSGFSQANIRHLSICEACAGGMTLRLPDVVRALRVDPMSAPGRFQLNAFSLQPIGRLRAASRLVQPVLHRVLANPSLVPGYLSGARRIARQSGVRAAIRHLLRARAFEASPEDYDAWVRLYDTLSDTDLQAIAARISAFEYRPLISVVVPVFNTPERILRKCLDSVLQQMYQRWELCLADDASSDPRVRAICERYAAEDSRIKFMQRENRGHIAAATNSALQLASGEFVALLDHDDELAPHALYMIAEVLNENRELDLIFSDEDKIDAQGKRFDPWFKSDWNYDLMLSQNAIVHLSVYRRSLLREIGGLRTGFDGSQDYDLLLRFSERTRPERIKHIPFVLYHWRAIEGSVALKATEKTYPYEAAAKAIQQHLDRTESGAIVSRDAHEGYYRVKWPLPAVPPSVSIIIPTRDKVDLLKTAVESIRTKTAYPNFRIVIVDNGSELEETKEYLSQVSRLPGVCVLEYDAPFSFAALNNWAVRQPQVDTPLIGFVNNDIEVISPGWLTEMVSHALRSGAGAVGAKLYYPDGTIQHAGIVVGLGGLAGHPHAGFPRETPGYFGRAVCTQQYSAVSAGCMVIRREVFLAIGGFDETNFRVAFNDVDLGLRLHLAGYSVVWTPHAELFHHESASLGLPSGRDRRELFEKESESLRRRWKDAVANDPYYNPNLTISGGDFRPCFPPRVQKPWRR